jgi:excinuclease ABC subunit C
MKTNADQILYPHLKITREDFPRLLATRKILDERDDYFGAFLPTTNVRLWLYQLNKIFRLRSCEIEIDGSWQKPCQMYFSKRCLAPCVREICSPEKYSETVDLLRLFLSNDEEFGQIISRKIEFHAENLEFETAANWRDFLESANRLRDNIKWQISLENAVDTYTYEETDEQIIVYLITTRGRKLAGNFEFIFANDNSLAEIFPKIIREFYLFHAPKEIRLPIKLNESRELAKSLSVKFGRKIQVTFHQNDLNLLTKFRLKRTKMNYELDKINVKFSADETSANLRKIFALPNKPSRIECFDVAHISNQNFVTATAVWENGKIRPEFSTHFVLDETSEIAAMASGVRERLKNNSLPDLILIDGGKSQLNAVLAELEKFGANISVISAVKPQGKHGGISHFLTFDGSKIEFIEGDRTLELLRLLRDEAHRTANELYRQLHGSRNIYETDLPLVPVRFDEIGGEAEDLIPIKTVLPKN